MNSSHAQNAIEMAIDGRRRDLGGFEVARILPYRRRKTVGPFILFDHMGPIDFDPGQGADVRPHPHIGLSTVTYLLDGAFLHRDSLGTEQLITPGAVNWMSAGRGITHSERTPSSSRKTASRVHGLQFWVAHPRANEDDAPFFQHCDPADLPEFSHDGVALRLLAGHALGHTAPTRNLSPLFYLDAQLPRRAHFTLPIEATERAIYPLDADVMVNGVRCPARTLSIFNPGIAVDIQSDAPTRAMLFGGEPLPEKRLIWWNFVASDSAHLEAAKRDWAAQRFATIPGDEHERIPLPKK